MSCLGQGGGDGVGGPGGGGEGGGGGGGGGGIVWVHEEVQGWGGEGNLRQIGETVEVARRCGIC